MKITCYLSQCTIFPYFIVPCHRTNHKKRPMPTVFTNFHTFCAFETGIWGAQEIPNFPLHPNCYHNSNTSLCDAVQSINSLLRDATSHTQLTFPLKFMHRLCTHCKAPPLLYSVLYIYVFFPLLLLLPTSSCCFSIPSSKQQQKNSPSSTVLKNIC